MSKIRRFLWGAALFLAVPAGWAIADYNATGGSGLTVFAFTCFSSKICPAQVLVDNTGTEKATNSNPLRIDPVGTTIQQVSGSVQQSGTWNIGTVTTVTNPVAATQSGTWTVQPGNTANTTPWLFQVRDAAGNARGANVNAANQLSVSCDAGCTAATATSPSYVSYGSTSYSLNAWSSSSPLNDTQSILSTALGNPPAILVQAVQTTPISAGALTFEGSYDGTNWVTIPVAQILNPNTFANLTNPYTLVASTNQPFLLLTQGYRTIRLKLSTGITGAGTVTPHVTHLASNPAVGAILNPLATGSNIIGQVGIDQTTVGTTNKVSMLDPCTFVAKSTTPINQAASVKIIPGTSSKKTYICSIVLFAAAAETISLTAGTGSTCGSGTSVIVGHTTTSQGMALPANGGLTFGNGAGSVLAATNANADDICLLQNGSNRVSGAVTYVQN